MLVALLSLLVFSAPPAKGPPATSPAALHPSQLRLPDPAAAPASGERLRSLDLVPRADGGFMYRGAEGERFDAIIHADGSVEFQVDPSVQLKLDGLCVLVTCVTRELVKPESESGQKRKRADAVKKTVAQTLAALGASAAASLAGTPTAALVSPGLNYLDHPHVDPPAHVRSAAAPPRQAVVGTAYGRFGYLPPPNAAMVSFLKRTFELRVELVKKADARRVAEQLSRLEPELSKAWDGAETTAARHQLVLDAWDDLDAPVTTHRDTYVAAEAEETLASRRDEARARGRALILRFVRERAPEGSPQAFSPQTLARFNARRSALARFEPYVTASEQ